MSDINVQDCPANLTHFSHFPHSGNGADDKNNQMKKILPVPSNDYEPGKPKILSKAKFCMAYEITASLKYVVIERFRPDLIIKDEFVCWLNKAQEYSVYSVKQSGLSVCMLKYDSVYEGEEAYLALSKCLSNEQCDVAHPRITKRTSQWLLQANDTGLSGLMYQIYQADQTPKDIFGQRSVMVENMPSCASEDLLKLFPGSLNIMNFTLDKFMKDAVVVELSSKEEAQQFVEKYNGAEIKDTTVCASLLQPRITKIQECFKKFNKKYGVDSTLSDEERAQSVRQLIELHNDKDALVNSTQVQAYDKERRFFQIEQEWEPLQRSLYSDAKRRYDNNIELVEKPEDVPEIMQKLVFGKGIFDKREVHRETSLRMLEAYRRRLHEETDEKMRRAEEAALGVMLIPKNPATRAAATEDQGKEMIPVPRMAGQKRGPVSDSGSQYVKKSFTSKSIPNIPSLFDIDASAGSKKSDRQANSRKSPVRLMEMMNTKSAERLHARGGITPLLANHEEKKKPLLVNPAYEGGCGSNRPIHSDSDYHSGQYDYSTQAGHSTYDSGYTDYSTYDAYHSSYGHASHQDAHGYYGAAAYDGLDCYGTATHPAAYATAWRGKGCGR